MDEGLDEGLLLLFSLFLYTFENFQSERLISLFNLISVSLTTSHLGNNAMATMRSVNKYFCKKILRKPLFMLGKILPDFRVIIHT